jgi:hypothetical protein
MTRGRYPRATTVKEQLLASEMLLSDEQLRATGCLTLESTHLEMYVTSSSTYFAYLTMTGQSSS